MQVVAEKTKKSVNQMSEVLALATASSEINQTAV